MRRDEIIGLANCTSPSSSSTPSSSRCRDCGNQAKKDCLHRRCRTCCRGHAFHCLTHVKSTWIPVSRRRPRDRTMHQPQQITPSHHHHQHLIQYGPNPSRSYGENPALGFQASNFPGETNLPATFRCVRVSSLDNEVDQYAYQTSVTIGGHIFTGVLYDQGPAEPEGTVNYVAGESTSADNSTGLLQRHNFVTTNDTGGNNNPTQFLPFTIDSNISHFS